MPPLKEYIFEDLDNSGIKIIIEAYGFRDAYELLISTVRNPTDFKCITV